MNANRTASRRDSAWLKFESEISKYRNTEAAKIRLPGIRVVTLPCGSALTNIPKHAAAPLHPAIAFPKPPFAMSETPVVAPALYTPDDHLFATPDPDDSTHPQTHLDLGDDAFKEIYDIDRTVKEIVRKGYRRVALQFPDELLGDSTRVYDLISRGINVGVPYYAGHGFSEKNVVESLEKLRVSGEEGGGCCGGDSKGQEKGCCGNSSSKEKSTTKDVLKTDSDEKKAFILADTSYSACCIDEIAAEHCGADVLVHYGRSCLSPTTRLPVIYVFTTNPLDLTSVVSSFCSTFPEKNAKVILMADVTYASHTPALHRLLVEGGYTDIFATSVIHNPSSPLPNRTLPPGGEDPETLRSYALFHISTPLPSLLLVLASRIASIHTYLPATSSVSTESTTVLLRRRYALLSHARTAGIIGILVNTLNVKNYLPMLSMVKRQIREAGRKSYLVVVGKVNVEKVANFSEVEVWVGVGCWEQGIVGSSGGREFYRAVITPFELSCALDKEKSWVGEWITDFESLLKIDVETTRSRAEQKTRAVAKTGEEEDEDSDDEPPEFDLRMGRYISTSRPLRQRKETALEETPNGTPSSALITSSSSSKQLSATGGVISPAAEFLRDKRSWRGLGSDFVIEYEKEGAKNGIEGAVVEAGRSGVARGYTVGGEGARH